MDRGSSIVGRHSREKDEAPATIGDMCRISYVSILPHVASCFTKSEFAHFCKSAAHGVLIWVKVSCLLFQGIQAH